MSPSGQLTSSANKLRSQLPQVPRLEDAGRHGRKGAGGEKYSGKAFTSPARREAREGGFHGPRAGGKAGAGAARRRRRDRPVGPGAALAPAPRPRLRRPLAAAAEGGGAGAAGGPPVQPPVLPCFVYAETLH